MGLISCLLSLSSDQKKYMVTIWQRLWFLRSILLSLVLLGIFPFAWGNWGAEISQDLQLTVGLGSDSTSVWCQAGNLTCPLPHVHYFSQPEVCFLLFWILSVYYTGTWYQAFGSLASLCLVKGPRLWLITDISRPWLMIALLLIICCVFFYQYGKWVIQILTKRRFMKKPCLYGQVLFSNPKSGYVDHRTGHLTHGYFIIVSVWRIVGWWWEDALEVVVGDAFLSG